MADITCPKCGNKHLVYKMKYGIVHGTDHVVYVYSLDDELIYSDAEYCSQHSMDDVEMKFDPLIFCSAYDLVIPVMSSKILNKAELLSDDKIGF